MIRSLLALALALILAAAAPARAETPLERGAYLVRGIMACGNCHTPKDAEGKPIAEREMAGGFVIEAPVFRAVVPNITPDKETGIGAWSDQEIMVALRDGRRPDGSMIRPPMPMELYRKISDADARAVVAYLRSLKPVPNKTEASSYKIPTPATYGPTVANVPNPPAANRVAQGRYLSDIGHCMECHTPMVRGRMDWSKTGAGGRELPAIPAGVVATANLTPANPDGIAKWTDAQVAHAIRAGERPDGRKLVPLMAFAVGGGSHDFFLTTIPKQVAANPSIDSFSWAIPLPH